MADLSTNIPQISFGQADKETAVNELFDAASPSMLFGRNGVTSAGLNFGIFGGRFKGLVIANSVQALTASATSYIEADATTGAVTKNTTGWTTGKLRLYKCVTNATAVTSYEDHRMLAAGTMSNITDKQGKVLDDLTPLLAADVDSAVEPKGYLVRDVGGYLDGAQLFVQQTPEGLVAQTIHVPLLGKSGFRRKPVGGAWSDLSFTIVPFDVVGWHGNTTAEAANAVINSDGTFSRSTFDVVAALADKLDADQVGVANGVASLGADGKVPAAQLPDLSITDTFVVADQVAMLALTAQRGDVAVRSDLNRSFILASEPASTLANWQELLTPTDAVLSVAGKTGAVTLANTDISGLGTAATQNSSAFATAAQGTLAGTALQPNAGLAAIDSAANILLNTIAKQYFVEVFRQPGDTDSQVIKKALAAIEANNKPAVLRFESGRTYTYDSSHSLGYINDLDIDLNGAKFVRANSGVVSTTLTADLPTSGGSSTTLYVASTPTNWSIGDIICARVGDGDNGISNVRRITGISGNTVTIHAALDGYTGLNPIPSGTTIVKSWSLFVGRPSANDSSTLLTEGANKRIRIHGGLIDGNRANQINRSWRYSTEIMLHSEGGAVYDCKFKDTSNECLVGHGFDVWGCTFTDLGGSALHTSANDATVATVSPEFFRNNVVKRTNIYGQSLSAHAEGAITFSWGAGRLVVADNYFDTGEEAALGSFGPSTGANADIYLTVVGNIFKNYDKIFYGLSTPLTGVVVVGNSFDNCGDNSSYTGLYSSGNMFDNNAASGGTILPAAPPPSNFAARNVVALQSSIATPTSFGNLSLRAVGSNGASGVNSGSITSQTAVIENNGAARLGLACSGSSNAALTFFAAGQTTFGSAYLDYTATTTTVTLATNVSGTGQIDLRTSGYSSHLKLDADGSTTHVRREGWFYLGDKNTDGSWAFDASGTGLLIKRRESGSWVTKSTISA